MSIEEKVKELLFNEPYPLEAILELIKEARIDELEKIPKEPNYGDEGKATEYVEERLNQLSQQTPNN